MTVFVPSKICEKTVVKIHKAVEYDSCKLWVHIRCNKINNQTYNLLMENETPWYCIKCAQSIPSFNGISSNELYYNIQGNKIKFKIFSKKTNPNQHILTESLTEMMSQEDLITLQAIITIKTLIKTFTFTMAQIFYIWTLTLIFAILMTFTHYYHNYLWSETL